MQPTLSQASPLAQKTAAEIIQNLELCGSQNTLYSGSFNGTMLFKPNGEFHAALPEVFHRDQHPSDIIVVNLQLSRAPQTHLPLTKNGVVQIFEPVSAAARDLIEQAFQLVDSTFRFQQGIPFALDTAARATHRTPLFANRSALFIPSDLKEIQLGHNLEDRTLKILSRAEFQPDHKAHCLLHQSTTHWLVNAESAGEKFLPIPPFGSDKSISINSKDAQALGIPTDWPLMCEIKFVTPDLLTITSRVSGGVEIERYSK